MSWRNRFVPGVAFEVTRDERNQRLERPRPDTEPAEKRHIARIAVSAGIAAVVALAYACAQDISSTGPGESAEITPPVPLRTAPVVGDGAASPALSAEGNRARASSAGSADRTAEAIRRVSWVGDIHNAAMRDLMANRDRWVGKDLRHTARVCRGIAELALKYTPQLKAQARILRSADEDRRVVRRAITSARSDCAEALPMSVFHGGARSLTVGGRQTEGTTEAWEPYAQNLLAGVQATDASVPAVAEAVNQVLSSASALSAGDFETLAAVASMANSSATQWNSFGEAGGFSGVQQPLLMSMFARAQWWRSNTMKVLYSDILGCIAGARTGGGAYGCAVWGLVGSAGFIVSIM